MKEYNDRQIKLISFYLPQFYTFKENDEWWGKGFTEWRNVKKARKLFDWHNQPQLPLDDYYYELNHNHHETMSWQIAIAKKYGIYGFCFYHYWFKDGKKLLEVPVEKFLYDKTLDINFCLCWANEHWTRAWDGGDKQIIMPQEYGNEAEWIKHFYYLLPFFKDKRYMKIDGKPLMIIYRVELIDEMDRMVDIWNDLANKEGLPGIQFISQGVIYATMNNKATKIKRHIMYEPGFTQASYSVRRTNLLKGFFNDPELFLNIETQKMKCLVGKLFGFKNAWWNTTLLDYDLIWHNILNRKIKESMIPGAFIDWDNSARRGSKGSRIIKGATPEKFNNYMKLLVRKVYKETNEDMIFITAWNEWAEGAHLEPDAKHKFGYLEALKDALENYNS